MRVQLKPQRKNPNRTSIYLDGKYAFSVDKETLARMGHFTDTEISQTELDKLLNEAEKNKARNYVFRLLSYRMRTKKELVDRLHRREYSDMVIQDLINELEKMKLIDDKKFAEIFAQDRLNFGGKGKKIIFSELFKKGINNQDIKNALADIKTEKEEDICKRLIEKYSNRYRNLSLNEKKKRFYGLLTRRGFSYPVIKKVLKINDET